MGNGLSLNSPIVWGYLFHSGVLTITLALSRSGWYWTRPDIESIPASLVVCGAYVLLTNPDPVLAWRLLCANTAVRVVPAIAYGLGKVPQPTRFVVGLVAQGVTAYMALQVVDHLVPQLLPRWPLSARLLCESALDDRKFTFATQVVINLQS